MLDVLDKTMVTSRPEFILKCAIQGLKASEEDYDELVKYEVKQLSKIPKVKDMFDGSRDEEALMQFKTKCHLVVDVKSTETDKLIDLSITVMVGGKTHVFNYNTKFLDALRSLHNIDPEAEMWNLIRHEVLQREWH